MIIYQYLRDFLIQPEDHKMFYMQGGEHTKDNNSIFFLF